MLFLFRSYLNEQVIIPVKTNNKLEKRKLNNHLPNTGKTSEFMQIPRKELIMLIYERNVNELKLKDLENLIEEKFCENNLLKFKKQQSQSENTAIMIICRLQMIMTVFLYMRLKKINELLYVNAKRNGMETKKQRGLTC